MLAYNLSKRVKVYAIDLITLRHWGSHLSYLSGEEILLQKTQMNSLVIQTRWPLEFLFISENLCSMPSRPFVLIMLLQDNKQIHEANTRTNWAWSAIDSSFLAEQLVNWIKAKLCDISGFFGFLDIGVFFEILLWTFWVINQIAKMPSTHCNDLFYWHKGENGRVGSTNRVKREGEGN